MRGMTQSAYPQPLLTTLMETVTQSWEQEAASRQPHNRHLPLLPKLGLPQFAVRQWNHDDKNRCAPTHVFTWRPSPFDNLYNTMPWLLITGSCSAITAESINKVSTWFLVESLHVNEKGVTLSHTDSKPEQNRLFRNLDFKQINSNPTILIIILGDNSSLKQF